MYYVLGKKRETAGLAGKSSKVVEKTEKEDCDRYIGQSVSQSRPPLAG